MSYIRVRHTSIIIPDYVLGTNTYVEKLLSTWNDSYYRYDPKAYLYNENKKELIVPRGLDLNFLERNFHKNIEVDYKPDPYETASYKLKKEPRSDIQKKSIAFLLGEGDFAYTKKYSQLALTLDTGDGKTYCVIAALTFMKQKSMIITHQDKIKKQWYDSFLKMTDINEKYICDISGSDIIDKLLKASTIPYKVFLVNHATLHSYGSRNGWDKIQELFQKIKIGVKVFDEAHLNFVNLMKVDLVTNTKKTFYLTANFERSDFKEKKLFELCFKNVARYGIETREEKRKHIIYIGVLFNSKPNLDVQASMLGPHGFDKNRYIDYEIKKPLFFEVIEFLINKFKDKEGKMLIFTPKIDSSQAVKDYLSERFPEKTVSVYNSTVSEEEKMVAKTSDIISSTIKSCGTGVDIPELRFVINAEPYASDITANQSSGRLREYRPDKYTFFIEIVDIGFKRAYEMYKKRAKVFKKKCFKMLEMKYPPNEQ